MRGSGGQGPASDSVVVSVGGMGCLFVSGPRERLFETRPDRCRHLVTVNAELLVLVHEHREFRDAVRDAHLTVDSRLLQLLLSRQSAQRVEKFSGSRVITDLADRCVCRREGLFILGGTVQSNASAVDALAGGRPDLRVSGYAPPLTSRPGEEWTLEVLKRVSDAVPTYLVVCLGAPKQELWIARNLAALEALGVRWVMGAGGAVDYLSGLIPTPPRFVEMGGMEWAFRLIWQPSRLPRTLRMFRALKYLHEPVGMSAIDRVGRPWDDEPEGS